MRRIALVILAAAQVALSDAAGAENEPRPAAELFRAGETLDFTLTWLHVVGGSMRMSIALVPGQPQYQISSLTESNAFFNVIYRVRDEVESVVSRDGFSTLRYHKKLNERGRIRDDLTVVDLQRHVAVRTRSSGTGGQMKAGADDEIPVPGPVFDPLSLIYHIRSLDLTPGRTHRFNVIADGKVYVLEASVIGQATIDTEAGRFRTVLVEPKMEFGGIFRDERNKLQIWYSDDAAHTPVRIRSEFKAGSITATLRAINRPAAQASPGTATPRPRQR